MAILVSRFAAGFCVTRPVAWLRQLGEFITIIITSAFRYLVFVISMYVQQFCRKHRFSHIILLSNHTLKIAIYFKMVTLTDVIFHFFMCLVLP